MNLSTTPNLPLAARYIRLALRQRDPIRTNLRFWHRKKYGVKRDIRRGDGFSKAPTRISLNLTRRCNLKCAMCVQHRHFGPPPENLYTYDPSRELSPETWIQFLREVAPFHPQVHITGGEPTLHTGLPDILAESNRLGLSVLLQTNGLRLSDLAETVISCNVTQLSISLDGPKEKHNLIRGRSDAFDRTVVGLQAVLEARRRQKAPGPVTVINCVISKDNLDVLDQMVPLAADLGADVLEFHHTIFDTRNRVDKHNRMLSSSYAQMKGFEIIEPSIPRGEYYESEITAHDLPLLVKQLKKARKLALNHKLVMLCFPNLSPELLPPYYLDLDYDFGELCESPWKMAKIMPDGVLSPCLHVVGGNVAETPFMEVWNSSSMRNFRKQIAQRLFLGCARCGSKTCLGVL